MSVYALLIGINDYAGNVPNLSGCHNDVERFKNVLKSRFAAVETDILMLKSRDATKANIVDGFETHLTQAGEGDTAVVYYSGHGSQERAPEVFWDIEPDRQNETLVCHDSRGGTGGGAGDLADKELRFLIAGLAKNNPHVVIIFDCCHSGSGTRGAGTIDTAAVRLTKPDLQSRSIDQYVFYETASDQGWVDDMRRLPEGRHVFLSGCQDSELSKELVIDGNRHGAFTHYLCKTLESAASTLSYRNIVSRINQQVQGLVQKQHPQVEGIAGADVNEHFMGGDIQPVKLVVTAKNNKWWLDAGAIHGMRAGDQLAIFKDIDNNTPLGTASIKTVESERSLLEFDDQGLDKTEAYLADVVHQSKPKLSIEIMGDVAGVEVAREVLQNMEGQGQASRFIQEKSNIEASYRLVAKDDRYSVTLSIDEQPLFMPIGGGYSERHAKKALRQLEHMAKWQHKLELDNFGSRANSKIADDAIQLVVKHANGETVDTDIELRYEQKNGEWVAPEFGVELRLNPSLNHPNPLYCALLFFNPLDGSIQSATDNGVWLRSQQMMDHDSGAANLQHAKPVVKIFDGEMIEAFVDDTLYDQGISESKDIFKLIISEVEFNASLLEQEGLELYDSTLDPVANRAATRGGNALESLLDDAMEYANTRGLRKKKTKLADWITKSLTLTTIRPQDSLLISEDEITSLGLGVEIEPHPISASISVESQTEASRGLENAGMGNRATPAALQDNSFTPAFSFTAFSSGSTRGGDADLSVVKLDILNDSANSVTPDQPLVISVDSKLEEGEQVLPFAFDGEFYYPLGHAVAKGNKTQVMIETLPDMSKVDHDIAEELTRGLGNSLKLYFQKVVYKTLKLEKDTVRLAIPQFDEKSKTEVVGFNEDFRAIKPKVKKAKKIVVFIHGIIGETKSMAGAVNFPLPDDRFIRDNYDVVLCFDYENLNTPIQDTAKMFKMKLEKAGLTEGHGKEVHVVAHSMGGLVSRWMIEQEGGNKLVSKLVMLGTPNNGSPWAGVKTQGTGMVRKWAFGSLTLILNGLTTVPIGGVAVAGMMKLIDSIDDTLDQMGEDSEFTRALYSSPDPQIPYYLVAGDTEKLHVDVDEEEGYKKIFKFALQRSKLAAFDMLSETLFSENNDVAVKLTSMKHVKQDRHPAMEITDVVSDHMSYFVTPASVEALDKALG